MVEALEKPVVEAGLETGLETVAQFVRFGLWFVSPVRLFRCLEEPIVFPYSQPFFCGPHFLACNWSRDFHHVVKRH